MPTVTATLAEKPTDLLVFLVDNGPATAREIIQRFGLDEVREAGGIYTGGLHLLRELGFVTGPLHERDQAWSATDDGRRAIGQARQHEGAIV